MSITTKPLYIIHNIWGPYFKTLGLNKYVNGRTILSDIIGAQNSTVVPVLNYGQSSINTRAKTLYQKLTDTYDKSNNSTGKIDVIACGLSGIDLRFAMHENPVLDNIIDNVITIASPHKGSMLASVYNNKQSTIDNINRACDLQGIRPESLKEQNYENMEQFNNFLEDYNVGRSIYSIGGERNMRNMHNILHQSAKQITEFRKGPFANTYSDGIFFSDETEFCTFDKNEDDEKYVSYHIGNIDADFLDLVGIGLRSLDVSGFHLAGRSQEKLESLKEDAESI